MANETTRSYWVNGAEIFHRGNKFRLIDAIGTKVYKEVNPLIISGTDAVLGHTVTLVEAGAGESTVAYGNVAGGGLLITTDAAEDDGVCILSNSLAYKVVSPVKLLYFGARLKISDATQSDLFVGLTVTDTTPLGGVTDGIYFEKLDGGTGFSFVTEKNSVETQSDSLATCVADTYVTLEWYADVPKGVVYALIDGSVVAVHTATIPDDEQLGFNFQFLTGEAAAKTCRLDWRRIIAVGGRDGETT